MASIYQRKDNKKWCVSYYVEGKRISETVSMNKKAAEYRRAEIEMELIRGDRPIDSETSLNILFKKYKEHLAAKSLSDGYRLKLETYFKNFKRYFESIGMKKVIDVKYKTLDTYFTKRITEDGIKPKTANGEIDFIRNVFKYAIKIGYLKVNPAKDIKRYRVVKNPPRYYTDEELNLIFANPSKFETYLMLLLHTGLRAGDVANLTWGDIDLDGGFIRVLMEKTEITVTIPISDQLKECLLDHITEDNRLFPDLLTLPKRSKVYKHLRNVLRDAGYKTNAPLHTFRHTFASRLVMRGVPLLQVSKWLGHRDISMTQIYAHLEPTSNKNEINKVSLNPVAISVAKHGLPSATTVENSRK
ncbi:MAG: site-specific integrase [Candidatus Marinimicrobia bacterium]|nr:site-specific integrase [Candidatus Neomarinimicrobiota bacterium]